MARGNKVLVEGSPRGVFKEGYIDGAYQPGILLTIKPGVAPVGGRFRYEAYLTTAGASDDPRMTCVLLEDSLGGKPMTQALVAGQLAQIYFPISGEEMNVLLAGQTGTGNLNVITYGERLSPVAGSGKLQPQATSGNRAPFQALESVTEVADVDVLVWCIYGVM